MRTLRPLFEHYVHKDDVQQRRTLRSAAQSSRQETEDAFEGYLSLMARGGTYGGEPELVAFTQVFDQDVTVHLPRIQDFNKDSIYYVNEHREGPATMPPLHICYGGDEVTRAHYDSARSRDGSTPRHKKSPMLRPQDSTRKSATNASSVTSQAIVSNRAIRGSRAELSSDFINDFLQKSKKDVELNFDQLNEKYRTRSPSVTSSQRSSSSKRSLDDDGEPVRATKRADRRKSTRRRADMTIAASDTDNDILPAIAIDSFSVDTPSSTQDTEALSDSQAPGARQTIEAEAATPDDESSQLDTIARPAKQATKMQPRIAINLVSNKPAVATSESSSSRLMSVAERPKSTLRA